MESVRIVLIDSCSMLDESNVLYPHSKKLTAVCPLLLQTYCRLPTFITSNAGHSLSSYLFITWMRINLKFTTEFGESVGWDHLQHKIVVFNLTIIGLIGFIH